MRRAENNWAWVHRAYTPSGLVSHDTLFTRTYETSAPYPGGPGDRHGGALVASDFTLHHVYPLRYSYDLDGRRRALYLPNGTVQQYGYANASGTLDTVIDGQGHLTTIAYDNAGRPVTTLFPGSYSVTTGYDDDSRLTRRLAVATSDTLTYDATSRVVGGQVYMPGAGFRDIQLMYTGLGALNWSAGITGGTGFEDFATDALGNRTWVRDQALGAYFDRTRYSSYSNGQLTQSVLGAGPCGVPGVSWSSCHPLWYHFEHNASYDASGNNDATWGEDTQGSDQQSALVLQDESRSYHGPDEKLMVQNRHLGVGTGSYPGGVFEEYRYDALGRRVLVRSRVTSSCAQSSGYHYQCRSYTERVVWDGDQVVMEIRAGGSDSLDVGFLEDDSGALPNTEPHMFGQVVYAHGRGIDQPVSILRLDAGSWGFLAPHTNWRGSYTYGTLADGGVCPGPGGCPFAPWPGDTRTADGGSTSTAPTQYTSWYGALITNKGDGSGLQYMRNRYYNPATGRFTQQDPIGLAGGLNLYGFAAGDPVNFSDPFGLCEPWPECGSGALASPGLLDPVMLLAGGIAGGIRAFFARAVTRAAVTDVTATAAAEIPAASNPALQRTVSALFRAGDRVPGGTAGAIRLEATTGRAVGGRFHLQKGIERMRNLENILGREELSGADRALAGRLLSDLRSAVRFAQDMAQRAAQ